MPGINYSDYRVLIVDDEAGIRLTLGCLLKNEGLVVDSVACGAEALALFQVNRFDIAFVDIMLVGESGIDLLARIKAISPTTQVVMFTGCPEVESAIEAVRQGAFDYLTKPVRIETLMAVLRDALSSKRLNDEQQRYRANLDAIFSSVSDAIIMIDREGVMVEFNAAAGDVCGYTKECIGRPATEIGLGCEGACRRLIVQTLQSESSQKLNRIECRKNDGAVRVVSFTATPVINSEGDVKGVVAVIRDETKLDELEKVLLQRNRFYSIIGSSLGMRKLYALTEALADVQTTVLINGESGTGKELFAAALHNAGSRKNGPFVKVNCSALSENLLESELFGHTRGAFTGAIADKIGRFEKAHGGTIFLDEIGDISQSMQMRLLRVLQEHEFERVGESTTRKVDVRVLAATNQDLSEKVRRGTFRQDLYYRINVVRLELPPLRERTDDIPQLVAHFLNIFNKKFGKDIRLVSDNVMDLFRIYGWPGNVRELEHVIEHACIICTSDMITVPDLPQDIVSSHSNSQGSSPLASQPSIQNLTLVQALAMSDGNKSQAARLLGISRRTVYRHLGE
jgi:PAS domain S-box-containing protein